MLLTLWLATTLVEAAAGTHAAGNDDHNGDDYRRHRGADGKGIGDTAIKTFEQIIRWFIK